MRRFITSLPGKVISQAVIAALVLPSVTLALFTRANAQIATLPSWAVTEFVNKKSAGTSYGKIAADSLASELGKSGEIDVVSSDSVKRAEDNLGIASPPDSLVNLLRLGQEVKASSVVKGEIDDYRVNTVAGGRQGAVVLNVIVYDTASGNTVNGSVIRGVSSIRAGSVTDDTLIQDAISQATSQAVQEIKSHKLPSATVLNTQANKALVNKGARSGFQDGQEVIVTRGNQLVATGKITDLEPSSAYVVAGKVYLGIQPGDKVKAIYKTSTVVINPNTGTPGIIKPRETSFPSGLVSVALVLGLVVALVGAGNGGSQGTTSSVVSQAMSYPNAAGVPAVLVTWSPNIFAGGNTQRAAWQVFRQDVALMPVGVVGGLIQDFVDPVGAGTAVGQLSYAQFPNNTIGVPVTCNYTTASDTTNATAIQSIVVGQQYIYQVQEVFSLLNIDLPNGGTQSTAGGTTGGNTGTTGGNTGTTGGGTGTTGGGTGTTGGGTGTTGGGTGTTGGGTGTTGGNTGTTSGTGTTGSTICYFLTAKVTAVGLATPINVPALQQPTEGTSLGSTIASSFVTNSVQGTNSPITVEYLLEISTTINFLPGTFFHVGSFSSNQPGTLPPVSVNPASVIRNFNTTSSYYWRYGARNIADVPGPAPDSLTREHYIFSPARSFKITGNPPPPPRKGVGTHTTPRGHGKAN